MAKNQSPSPVSRQFFLTAVLAAFALGVFAGSGFVSFVGPDQRDKSAFTDRDEEFKYIRPAIPLNSAEQHSNRELAPFRYKIKGFIDGRIGKNELRTASVYFRDLNNGSWFGIGEKEKFSPQNLLKVPLMIAYFKWAESNPLVLRKRLLYAAPAVSAEQKQDGAQSGLEPGREYSVNDLIFRMITADDDQAYSLLSANIPKSRIDRVFKNLNVEYDPHAADDRLSFSAFASFYRVLFNASYLNEEMSEKALRYCANSSLKHGMAWGIPADIDISSKFGERTIKTTESGKEAELVQMHEFGIVYHPRRPFLLGILVRGHDAETLTRVIRDITEMVYEEVDRQSEQAA